MARRILILAVAFSLLLFIIFNFRAPIRIQGDGVFYYSYLHSVLFDHDLDFKNELQHYSSYDAGSLWFLEHQILTPRSMVPNAYAYGTAIMWLPFILVAHFLTWLAGYLQPSLFVLDGYSYFYNLGINFGSWLFGILALLINYKTAKKFFNEIVSAKAVIALFLATPWIYYQIFEPSMSHMASLLAVSTFVYLLIKLYQGEKVNRWLLSGVIFLMLAIRWQNLFFGLAFIPLLIKELRVKEYKKIVSQALVFLVPMIIFWVSQSLLWFYLYGRYILTPQGSHFVRPEFHGLTILFSADHGLLLWSPIVALAIFGWWFLGKKYKYLLMMSVLVFVAEWLINGSLNDLGGGDAYGGRRFIEVMPFFVLGLAALWVRIRKYPWIFSSLIIVLIAWNFLLLENYRLGFIPHAGNFDFFGHNYLKALTFDFNRYLGWQNN